MRLFITGFFLCIVLPSQIWAEDALSLKQTLDRAYEYNPRMIQAAQAITAAQGDLITARGLKNPQVELEWGGFKRNEEGKRKTNLDTIEIRQPFDPIGVHFLEGKIASNDVKIQQQAFKSVWASVYWVVRENYAQIILRQKQLELAESNLQATRQFFSRVQLRYQSGQVLKNDFQRARIELLQAENEAFAARKDLKLYKARLNRVLGRPMEHELNIQETLQEERLKQSFEELSQMALANRPDLKGEALALDSSRKSVAKEELSRLPSFSIGLQRTDTDYDKDYAVVLGVEVPFWNLNQGAVKKAKAEQAAQTARAEAFKNDVLFEVYEAYLTAELKQKQFDLNKKAQEEAQELFHLANLRYAEGKIDFLNYLEQIKTAKTAKVNYYNALFDFNQSISTLETSVYASLRQGEEFLK